MRQGEREVQPLQLCIVYSVEWENAKMFHFIFFNNIFMAGTSDVSHFDILSWSRFSIFLIICRRTVFEYAFKILYNEFMVYLVVHYSVLVFLEHLKF
jgi:hypothetical protein